MKIPYGKQWISEDDIEAVSDILKSDFLTTGPTVTQFEKEFAKYVGSRYAVAVSNGTAALHLSAEALNVQEDSEVIVPPMSFAATSNCILYNSGKPIFADITERGLIDPLEIEKNLDDKTEGLIPVHYMGLPCDLKKISEIAKENNLFVIEDACHALGAKYESEMIGNCRYSDLAVFSFHPVKHITTGEGGIITTNNKEVFSKLLMLRTHGITKDRTKYKVKTTEPWYHEMHYLGYNYRLTDIQAALGLSQLAKIQKFIERRREIATMYNSFFSEFDHEVEIISENENEFHSYHLYVVKLKNTKKRRELFEFLMNNNVYCQVHYIPIYWHPYYQKLGYRKKLCPRSEDFYERIISLPMYPAMTDDEIYYVLSLLNKFFK